jgi:hypothetical protein
MKILRSVKLLAIVLLSCAVSAGCANQQMKGSGAAQASKAAPEARQAIQDAADAIAMANKNNWIWRDTEDLLKQAQAAADGGDNAKAVELANKAKYQAEAAIIQYNHEKTHPRGF